MSISEWKEYFRRKFETLSRAKPQRPQRTAKIKMDYCCNTSRRTSFSLRALRLCAKMIGFGLSGLGGGDSFV
jgi:hypothetical protein